MDLTELRAFLAVAETGSFAAAAQRMACSRTTLTRRIDALEARVGAPLLTRQPSGAVLTAAGQIMAPRGPLLLGEASALLRAVLSEQVKQPQKLRLLLPVGMPPTMLGVAYQMLRSQFPEVRLSAEFVSAELLATHVDGFDVITHFGESALPGDRWVTRPLVWLREWLLATPAYLAQHGEPTSIEELATHRLLSWDAPGRDPDRWPTLAGTEFAVEPLAHGPDVHFLRHLAAAHQGIALLPDAEVAEPEFPPGTFQVVLREVVGSTVPLCVSVPVVSKRSPQLVPILQAIEAFLAAV